MIVGIVNELYEGLGPILFYVVLASVLLHVIALVRKSRFFFSSTRERCHVRSIFFQKIRNLTHNHQQNTHRRSGCGNLPLTYLRNDWVLGKFIIRTPLIVGNTGK